MPLCLFSNLVSYNHPLHLRYHIKARTFFDTLKLFDNTMEGEQMLYDLYIKDDREIKYTNEGALLF